MQYVDSHLKRKVGEIHLGTERILRAVNRINIHHRVGEETRHTDAHTDARRVLLIS